MPLRTSGYGPALTTPHTPSLELVCGNSFTTSQSMNKQMPGTFLISMSSFDPLPTPQMGAIQLYIVQIGKLWFFWMAFKFRQFDLFQACALENCKTSPFKSLDHSHRSCLGLCPEVFQNLGSIFMKSLGGLIRLP